MPSTVVTSDTINPLAGLNGRIADYTQAGHIWVAMSDEGLTNTGIRFYRSTDNGANWSLAGTLAGTTSDSLYSSTMAFFIDKDNGFHLVYFESSGTDRLVYRYGTLDSGGASVTWSAMLDVSPLTSGTSGSGVDLVAHREGSGWKAHAFAPFYDPGSASMKHYWFEITISASKVPSLTNTTMLHDYGINVIPLVSADFRHEATDPKAVQSSTPSLYAAYYEITTGSNLFYKKIAYSGGTWTPGTERVIDANAQYQSSYPLSLVYDGTRVMIVSTRNATNTVVRCFERDEADTTTTSRDPTALSDGIVRNLGIGATTNGDVWLVAQGDTSVDWKKIRFNRAGVTWGSWSVIDADASLGNGILTVCRGMLDSLYAVYQLFTPSPNQTRIETLVSAFDAGANLVGVGSMSGQAALGFIGQAALQGVGSISPTAAMGFNPPASLQGVGTFGPNGAEASLVPFRDFTVYDGYLAGADLSEAVGLIYFEGEGFRNTEESQPLRPPRSDIGNEPTEVRPESGEIFSQQDFSNGSGQLYYHHEGRDVRRYLWSEGFDVDIDTVGRPATLVHLHDVPVAAYSSANVADIVIFNDLPFVIDGTSFRRGNGDFPGSWTAEDPHATETATTIQDATSSGEYLYAALGANGIHRRDTTGAWSHWSDVQATRISWVKNRIIAVATQSIYEVINAGAAPTPIETLPAGWSFQDIFEVSGFIYAIASNSTAALTRVHAYGLNEAGSAVEKKSETPFPNDQLLVSGVGYLDTCFIGGGIRTPDGGYDPVVYQALVVDRDRGALSYSKITEGEGAGAIDLSVLAFEPMGENVLCGWSLGSGFPFGARDGLALYKLKNGAFFPYLKTAGAGTGKQVRSIAAYKGRILFTTRGGGLYYEDPTKYVLNAYLVSSVADWNTTALKAWDTIQMSHNPLPSGTSVAIDYAVDLPTGIDQHPGGDWIQAMSHSVAGEELDQVTFTGLSSRLLSIRIRSTASSDQLRAPSGHGFLVRSNVLPDDAEWRLTRYIRILKRDRKDSHGEDVYIANTHTRKRDLQLTAYKWITLYEPGVVWTCRVAKISNITPLIPQFEETVGEERSEAYVMQLTLEGVRD